MVGGAKAIRFWKDHSKHLPTVENGQKISVLLSEYNTLRSEVLAARANVARAIALTAAVLMGALGFSFSRDVTWASVGMFLLITLIAFGYLRFTFGWNEKNTRTFTKRIREIETDINKRAGERLLLWETDYGWGSIFPRCINPDYKGYSYRPMRHF